MTERRREGEGESKGWKDEEREGWEWARERARKKARGVERRRMELRERLETQIVRRSNVVMEQMLSRCGEELRKEMEGGTGRMQILLDVMLGKNEVFK